MGNRSLEEHDDGRADSRWMRAGGCTSDHVGDAATVHAGGAATYTRTYSDGCQETQVLR